MLSIGTFVFRFCAVVVLIGGFVVGDELRSWQVKSVTVPVHGNVDELGYVYVKTVLKQDDRAKGGMPFRMILDTGSIRSYLPCSGCTIEACGQRRMSHYLNREHQSTELLCFDSMCPSNRENGCEQTEFGMTDECLMKQEYLDGSSIEGVYVNVQMNLSSYYSWQPLACATKMSPVFQQQFADGSLGIGPDAPFLRLNANGFSLCLAPAGMYGGNLTIGREVDFNSNHSTWVDLAQHGMNYGSSQYRVLLKSEAPFSIQNLPVESNRQIGAIFDTGSSLSWLPKDIFSHARAQLFVKCGEEGSQCPGTRVTGDMKALACYDIDEAVKSLPNDLDDAKLELEILAILARFPVFEFVITDLTNHVLKYTIQPREYFYKGTSVNEYCVGFMSDDSDDGDIVLGLNVLRGWDIAVNLEDSKLSLAACDLQFDLDNLIEEEEEFEGLENNTAYAHAGILGFIIGFFSTMLCCCCCTRRVLASSKTNYDALEGFGDLDSDHGNQTASFADKFAIDSDSSDDESGVSSGFDNDGTSQRKGESQAIDIN